MTLGNFATKLLLNTDTGITRLRGRLHPWWLGSSLVPTFHPAAALRGGDRVTNQMREDFALVRSILDRLDQEPQVTEEADAADPSQMDLFG
jgi:DNA polymerase